jgi:hypothetical protein
MPKRWVSTKVEWWQLAGSYLLLFAAFYLLRRLAAKIFRISILIGSNVEIKSPVYFAGFNSIPVDTGS